VFFKIVFTTFLGEPNVGLYDKSLFVERINENAMYNKSIKTVIEFGFCDIPNYQGVGKCYQSHPCNNCLKLSS
jgi:hypothetical protein